MGRAVKKYSTKAELFPRKSDISTRRRPVVRLNGQLPIRGAERRHRDGVNLTHGFLAGGSADPAGERGVEESGPQRRGSGKNRTAPRKNAGPGLSRCL
ncbi:hypothetical protein GWI33_015348 [Rhynchophorus ferrugineus]|uniref:Uncharacterized protein n=1 Tax=Rhynchophorus ferrugineus TaxID=354439 RepID=A0A834I0X5_RHYFE|nr:hypothetical protein GWI33_015348 [Rhynchophorus ferrugineus]